MVFSGGGGEKRKKTILEKFKLLNEYVVFVFIEAPSGYITERVLDNDISGDKRNKVCYAQILKVIRIGNFP